MFSRKAFVDSKKRIWPGSGGKFISRTKVSRSQQNDSDADRLRRRDHLLASRFGSSYGLSVRGVVEIMELAYGRRSSKNHFKKRHARDIIDVLGSSWLAA